MVKGGDVLERYHDTFMAHLKQFLEWSLKTVSSCTAGPLTITDLLLAGQFAHDSGSKHMFTVLRTRACARDRIRPCVRTRPRQFVENGRVYEETSGSAVPDYGYYDPQAYLSPATHDPAYAVGYLTRQDRPGQSLRFGAHQDVYRNSRFESQTSNRDLWRSGHTGELC